MFIFNLPFYAETVNMTMVAENLFKVVLRTLHLLYSVF